MSFGLPVCESLIISLASVHLLGNYILFCYMTTFVKLLGHLWKLRIRIAIVLMQEFLRFVKEELMLALYIRNARSEGSFSKFFNIIRRFKYDAIEEILFDNPFIIKTPDLKLFPSILFLFKCKSNVKYHFINEQCCINS